MLSRIQQAKAIVYSVVTERNALGLDSVNRCLIQAFDLLTAAEIELRDGKPLARAAEARPRRDGLR